MYAQRNKSEGKDEKRPSQGTITNADHRYIQCQS